MQRSPSHLQTPPAPPKDAGQGAAPAGLPPRRSWLAFLAILFLNFLVVRYFFPASGEPVTVPYTVFKAEVAKGNVAAIYSRGASIEGRFDAPVTWPPEGEGKEPVRKGLPRPQPPRTSDTFTTELPAFVDPGLERYLIDN